MYCCSYFAFTALLSLSSLPLSFFLFVCLLSYISLAGFQRVQIIDPVLSIHFYSKNFHAVWHVLSITAFYMRLGCRLSSFKLSCNLFRIIPIVDSTDGAM